MRFVFLDEGGISTHEPFVVVGGVFVHGDAQVPPLEDHLESLVQKHIPKKDWQGFVFHAKDIWSGAKYFKNRDEWPGERRMPILEELADIPQKLDIPIVFHFLPRAQIKFDDLPREPTNKEFNIAIHSMTFSGCTLRIEQHMREIWPNEIAQLVAEDNEQARATIKGAHEILRNPPPDTLKLVEDKELLPLKNIRSSVHFATKAESRPLQLADVCTFIIRAHLARHPKIGPLYTRIHSMMMYWPNLDAVSLAD